MTSLVALPTTTSTLPGVLGPYVWPGAHVAVVSGSYGAGHDAAAREIRLRLEAMGCVVDSYDVADLLPFGIGSLLRRLYFLQLRVAPRSWGTLLDSIRPGSWTHRLALRLLGLASPALAGIGAHRDLVVTTHHFAAQALGRARQDGLLRRPVVTYLTDPSVHPLWVHPAVDEHLALGEVAATQARRWGVRATVVEPVVPRHCQIVRSADPEDVRAGLDLPFEGPFALVCGGSLGIGQLARTADDVLGSGLLTPVVLCGHNQGLRRRLARRRGVVALPWRTDLPDLMRAARCVIQNSGGFMAEEALATGARVISYRCIPGHGEENAAALEQAGLAPWARDRAALLGELREAVVATSAGPGRLAG